MNTDFLSARAENRWDAGPGPTADALDELVYLSKCIGQDVRLVQPGGGNTSRKVGDELFVKGSGTDLRTVGRTGFTRLSLTALAALANAQDMPDADMMRFMARCMTDPAAPLPSVETPLHSLLPFPVIAHTHDVATMSLTNVRDDLGARLVDEVFGEEIMYVPYVRPGFPLARAVRDVASSISARTMGLALAHHGLMVWADTAHECYARLVDCTARIEAFLAARRPAVSIGATARADSATQAQIVLPVVRGALGEPRRVVLHLDDHPAVLDALGRPGLEELARRGMATPEHILRAGRLPAWVELGDAADADTTAASVRRQLEAQQAEYDAYHARHAQGGEPPLADWAKVVLVPGLGVITAGRDARSAGTAATCYRAVLAAMANADAIDAFQFIPEADVFAFEHWPLERRKIDEQDARDRATLLLPRHVAVVIGAGSGIGRAAAHRFAREGAHVVAADLDLSAARTVADEIQANHAGRAVAEPLDVRDDASIDRLFERTVLAFGGIDSLFYTAGLPPRFARVADVRRDDLQRQLDVHYLGAVLAIGAAARLMRRQGLGGSIIASVSKAALAPGRDAVAYGASKAALLQALRVAAIELGRDGIRVNAINADQVDTPLFRQFVRERAAMRGISETEQLEAYRARNALGTPLIPADAVADIAVLLASERFRYTTGDILTVDGGLAEAFPR